MIVSQHFCHLYPSTCLQTTQFALFQSDNNANEASGGLNHKSSNQKSPAQMEKDQNRAAGLSFHHLLEKSPNLRM